MKIINFFISLCLVSTLVSGQTNHINYEITYDLNFRKYIKENEPLTYESWKLFINNEYSVSISENIMNRYGFNHPEYPSLTKALFNNSYPLRFDSDIIKKEKEKYIYIRRNNKGGFLAYQETKVDLADWDIRADTATIAGLMSQKASCTLDGRDWTAWFSTEIPISDGPHKFSGLPGLIVKIESEDGDYSYQIRSIKKMEDQFVHVPKFNLIPREKFNQHFARRVTNVQDYYKIDPKATYTINGKNISMAEYIELLERSPKINTIEKLNFY